LRGHSRNGIAVAHGGLCFGALPVRLAALLSALGTGGADGGPAARLSISTLATVCYVRRGFAERRMQRAQSVGSGSELDAVGTPTGDAAVGRAALPFHPRWGGGRDDEPDDAAFDWRVLLTEERLHFAHSVEEEGIEGIKWARAKFQVRFRSRVRTSQLRRRLTIPHALFVRGPPKVARAASIPVPEADRV
jgi:hypothetical protein